MSRALTLRAVTLAVALALLGAWLLRDPWAAAQRSTRVEHALNQLTEGLAHYHGTMGSYPAGTGLSGGELAARLTRAGVLTRQLLNPDTGAPYGTDPLEVDKTFYTAGTDGQSFTLEVLAADGDHIVAARRGPPQP